MKLSGFVLLAVVVLAVLAATGTVSLDGALAGWEGLAAKLSPHGL